MSSKSKRPSTRSTRESMIQLDISQQDESVNASTYSPNNTSTSCTRWSRQQEKEQLSSLNDRLATYIERVRNLEQENAHLNVQVREVEAIERKEKNDLIARYEAKISDLRKQLDFVTRENARLEIDKTKAVDGHSELKSRVGELEKKLKKSEVESKNSFNHIQDLTARLNNAENARSIAEKENNTLKSEIETMQKQLDLLHKQLEDEVVLRTELEQKLMACKEDLDFARRNHSAQMEEFRRKRQVEMTSFSNEIETRYQTKLQEQLQNMRDNFDQRIAQNRAELDELFKSKLNEAESNAARSRALANEVREDATRWRLRAQELETTINSHDSQINTLNGRIRDLEAQLRRLQEESDLRIKQREERIMALEREAATMLNEYQDLMDLKVQLDTELQAYHKLLEGEETRLHITPVTSPNNSHVSFEDPVTGSLKSNIRRGIKRRHSDEEGFYDFKQATKTFKSVSKADGDVEIDEIDTNGQYIRLYNKGAQDIALGGYCLKSTAGVIEAKFNFRSRQLIKVGKSITIWSANSEQPNNPPLHIVMKNQKWPTGDAFRAELLNNEGKVVAFRETLLHHDFIRTENGIDPDQRCLVM